MRKYFRINRRACNCERRKNLSLRNLSNVLVHKFPPDLFRAYDKLVCKSHKSQTSFYVATFSHDFPAVHLEKFDRKSYFEGMMVILPAFLAARCYVNYRNCVWMWKNFLSHESRKKCWRKKGKDWGWSEQKTLLCEWNEDDCDVGLCGSLAKILQPSISQPFLPWLLLNETMENIFEYFYVRKRNIVKLLRRILSQIFPTSQVNEFASAFVLRTIALVT